MHRFFAVTIHGSIYEVTDEIGENDWPIVKRVSGPENVRMPNGTCLRFGQFVGISEYGICLFRFHPTHGRHFENMNTVNHGGRTSGLVALFFCRKSAEICVRIGDLGGLNDRYHAQTLAVLRKIGDDHEIFTIGETIKYHFLP